MVMTREDSEKRESVARMEESKVGWLYVRPGSDVGSTVAFTFRLCNGALTFAETVYYCGEEIAFGIRQGSMVPTLPIMISKH